VVQRPQRRPAPPLARPRPRRLLRREPRRDHGHGVLLSRPRPKRRRLAATPGMRPLVASAAAAAFRRDWPDLAGRLVRDPILPAGNPAGIYDGRVAALARLPAGVFRIAASELAHHRLGTRQSV